MNTNPDQAYDDFTNLAALICETPTALVSRTDDGRQRLKSDHGLDAALACQVLSFCEMTIARPDTLFMIADPCLDGPISDDPVKSDAMQICFYAGAALVNKNGDTLGTLCVIDNIPRELTDEQQNALRALSRQVVTLIELRAAVQEMEDSTEKLHNYQNQLEDYQQKLELTNARLRTLSVTDDLTGLNNRFAFEEELRNEFDAARRGDLPLSLLFLDADRFKSYNDDFGHPAGDDALRIVAEFLQKSVRKSDFVARIGGDEFVIILPRTSSQGACALAEQCRKALESATWPERSVTVSIGIASLAADIPNTSSLISEADQALYNAKANGRNRVSRRRLLHEQEFLKSVL